ncbi:MAG: PH domain-containing protein [Anaerolineae bacterium]
MWLCLQWLAQTVTPEEEASQLVIRGGVLHVHEERIPLNRVTGISYEKPWWATLLRLNAATVVVEVFGRTRTLPYIHRYQELWQALQGTGQTGVVWVRRTQAQ